MALHQSHQKVNPSHQAQKVKGLQLRVKVMMDLCQMIVMKMVKTCHNRIIASSLKIESRKVQMPLRRSKKVKNFTKTLTSQFKTRLDGMISHMQVALVYHSTREVLSGKEFAMSILLTKAILFGVVIVISLPCMIFDRDKLETVGSWQQQVH